jgi:hypothetical protein
MSENEESAATTAGHPTLLAIGWVSLGVGIAAAGLFLGRELRKRYRFNHRTPYDFYANAANSGNSEFGMGI